MTVASGYQRRSKRNRGHNQYTINVKTDQSLFMGMSYKYFCNLSIY